MALFVSNIITSDSALGSAKIQRSLRFNHSDDAYFNRSSGTSTNQYKWTFSAWIKLCRGAEEAINYGELINGHTGNGSDNNFGAVYFYSGVLRFAGWGTGWRHTTRKFSDSTSWMHVMVAVDTSNGTASNRVKMYVNGVEETAFGTNNNPSQNSTVGINQNSATIQIGRDNSNSSDRAFDGYMAEVHFIDGQQLDASYFGFTDPVTSIWMPRRYEGTYGNNGFYLDFSDNSSTAALGIDKSPNGNDFTANNFSVSAGDGNDSRTDTPTLRKATLNHITGFTNNATLKNGDLEMTGSAGFKEISSICVDGTDKFYYELVRTNAAGWQLVGIFIGQPNNPSNALTNSAIWGFASTQAQYFGGTYTSTSNVPGWSVNNVMGIKYENGTLKLYKDGTLATSNATGIPTDDVIFAYIANDNTNAASFVRFDSDSWTQATAAGVDSTWELSGKKLSPNVPSIVRPKRHFDTLLYDGNDATSRTITGLDFSPDLIIQKRRSDVSSFVVWDSIRGVNKTLYTEDTYAETTSDSTGYITDFGTNGFTFATTSPAQSNASGHTYCAWCWKAGGAGVANSDGSTASTVSVNQEAGFSMLLYTGTGSLTTIGHGLNGAPEMIWTKSRSTTGNWGVLDTVVNTTAENRLHLNDNGGYSSYQGYKLWGDTVPTSSVFTVREDASTNANGVTYVAYCWRSVPGYSKIGSYTGNGSTDGTYVHLGFRPAFVLLKRTSASASWVLHDYKRAGYNGDNDYFHPDNTQAESDGSTGTIDFLANGFKLRMTAGTHNDGTFIYMAFAEQPGTTPFDTITNSR